jgi:hypothetical protein
MAELFATSFSGVAAPSITDCLEHLGELLRMLAFPLLAPCSPPQARYVRLTFLNLYVPFLLPFCPPSLVTRNPISVSRLPIVTLIPNVSAIAVSRPLSPPRRQRTKLGGPVIRKPPCVCHLWMIVFKYVWLRLVLTLLTRTQYQFFFLRTRVYPQLTVWQTLIQLTFITASGTF